MLPGRLSGAFCGWLLSSRDDVLNMLSRAPLLGVVRPDGKCAFEIAIAIY